MGGGRGNGAGFDPGILEDAGTWPENPGNGEEGMEVSGEGALPEGMGMPGEGALPEGMETGKGPDGPGGMSMGSDDVSLIYTDDEYDSYSNIFDNAKWLILSK